MATGTEEGREDRGEAVSVRSEHSKGRQIRRENMVHEINSHLDAKQAADVSFNK